MDYTIMMDSDLCVLGAISSQRVTDDKDVNKAQDEVGNTAGGLVGKGGVGEDAGGLLSKGL